MATLRVLVHIPIARGEERGQVIEIEDNQKNRLLAARGFYMIREDEPEVDPESPAAPVVVPEPEKDHAVQTPEVINTF